MSKCCDEISNPLVRDGQSQGLREPQFLAPGKANADDRSLIDFLYFTYRFSALVKYFPLSGMPPKQEGQHNWQLFFEKETAFLVAIIAKKDIDGLRSLLDEELLGLVENPTAERANKLIDLLLGELLEIEQWHNYLDNRSGLKLLIKTTIQSQLGALVQNIRLLDEAIVPPLSSKYSAFRTFELQKAGMPPLGNNPFNGESIFTLISELERNADLLIKELRFISESAPNYLEEAFAHQDLPPHIALFVSFAKLLTNNIQTNFNEKITKEHLDFFYRKILRINEKQAIADSVHLLFEPAKHVAAHKVAQGTLFEAGKDEEGQDILFGLDEEIIVNKAQVEALKTIYVEKQKGENDLTYTTNLFAAPIANSGDGLGGDFPKDEIPTWKTLGGTGKGKMPDLGFLIASETLALAEGTREITFTFNMESPFASALEKAFNADLFQIFLSGEKGWITQLSEEGEPQFEVEATTEGGSGFMLKITMGKTSPALLPFDLSVFEEEDYGTDLPVAKILLNKSSRINIVQESGPPIEALSYHFLKEVCITGIGIDVAVAGVENTVAKNDLGVLDTSKAFMPFGPLPKIGASFFVGTPEFEGKNISDVSLSFEWEVALGEYENTNQLAKEALISEVVQADFIQNGSVISVDIFKENEANNIANLVFQEDPLSSELFFEMRLNGSFGHEEFSALYAKQAMALALQTGDANAKFLLGAYYQQSANSTPVLYTETNDEGIDNTWSVPLPNAAFTPSLKKMTLGYTASESLEEFTQLHAFGGYQKMNIEGANTKKLLPLYEDEGTLYIGVRDLPTQSNLPLLFQVEEATASADSGRAKINWAYLKNQPLEGDIWEQFTELQLLSDTTKELISSGIVKLDIPKEVGTEHTTFSQGLSWIKVWAQTSTKAIPEAINVHAQAVKASFVLGSSNVGRLFQPLAAETIAKFVENDPSIKGVVQPYDSFGGRPVESSVAYYTRVSEHLRHKGRAITLFDYERLVLENFPNIYKARCINHTNQGKELAPGFVTLAVVPEQKNKKVLEPLKPKATVNELDEILLFLKKKTTPHARIKVVNPKYESIKVAFDVKFRLGKPFSFYQLVLNEAIKKFLSPWAFEEGQEISFGGKVFRSSILNFVEEQEYVDYVLNFKMFHNEAGIDIAEAVPTSAQTILTSVATHEILEVMVEPTENALIKGKSGLIGYAKMGDIISSD